jgi:hypothetical protein
MLFSVRTISRPMVRRLPDGWLLQSAVAREDAVFPQYTRNPVRRRGIGLLTGTAGGRAARWFCRPRLPSRSQCFAPQTQSIVLLCEVLTKYSIPPCETFVCPRYFCKLLGGDEVFLGCRVRVSEEPFPTGDCFKFAFFRNQTFGIVRPIAGDVFSPRRCLKPAMIFRATGFLRICVKTSVCVLGG